MSENAGGSDAGDRELRVGVDVVFAALADAAPERVPAGGQGTMNNLTIGAGGREGFTYYETIGGGAGEHRGGHGLVRSVRVLEDATVSLLTERRRTAPKGVDGGDDGAPGRNLTRRRPGGGQGGP